MSFGSTVIVRDIGFGDGGKGTTVDALARLFGSSLVVRDNGGPQALHFVVAPNGVSHGFAQFGSGSLCEESRTVLSSGMLVDLDRLEVEADVLGKKVSYDVWSRLTVDPDCLLVTPMQVAAGRLRENMRGANAHGSCGLGVGETVFDDEAGLSIRVRDLFDARAATERLDAILSAKRAAFDDVLDLDVEDLCYRYRRILDRLTVEPAVDVIRRDALQRSLIFEGAQGALLDWRRGFVPHVTKTDTTQANATALLRLTGMTRAYTLGVLRAYGHRHGAGPFVTEEASMRVRFDDPRNVKNRWQGAFRVGWLDLLALRYGIRMNGRLDGLSVTGIDRLSGLNRVRVCVAYRTPDGRRLADIPDDDISAVERTALVASCTPEYVELPGWSEDLSDMRCFDELPAAARALVAFVESEDGLALPVAILSVGPRSDQKIFRSP